MSVMGCCPSVTDLASFPCMGHWNTPEGYYNKELNPVATPWMLDEIVKLTKQEILEYRRAFWLGAVTSGTRKQRKVFLIIKGAADDFFEGKVERAQMKIKNSKLFIPHGDLSVVIDEDDDIYFIPLYCMSYPDDAIESRPGDEEIKAGDIVMSGTIHSSPSPVPID